MKVLLLALLCIFPLAAQTPNCQFSATFTANGTYLGPGGNGFDNRNIACVTWAVQYEAQGFTAFTLSFESSVGATTPTSYGAYTGTTIFSSPSFGTNTTGGIATYSNLQTGTVVATPWITVKLASAMGSGTVRVFVSGWQTGATGGTGGGGGGGGGSGCPNPCPVVGTAASGSPPSGDPVQIGGFDGTDLRVLSTDAAGRVNILGGQPAATTATWTSATPMNSTVAVSTVGYGNVLAAVVITGSVTSGTITFEASPDGGTTWLPISMVAINSTTSSASGWALSSGNNAWQMFVGGLTNFRVRLSSTFASGGSAEILISPSAIATEFQQIVGQASGANLHVDVDSLGGTGTFNAGQQAVTGTAVALPTHAANSVCVQALLENTINVYIGPSGVTTSTGLELTPGVAFCGQLNNTNLIYVIASTTGASVSWALTD